MDECCGICGACVCCFGCVAAAFGYLPFQTIVNFCKCKGCPRRDPDEDFDPMANPVQNAMFTADGERIQREPYGRAVPMHTHSASQHQLLPHSSSDMTAQGNGDPFATPRPSSAVSVDARPPPDYPAAVRAGILSDSEEPLRTDYRTGLDSMN